MRFLRVTEAEVRAAAMARGLDPDLVVTDAYRGGLAQRTWDLLRAAIPSDDPARTLVDAATLIFDPSIASEAKTVEFGGVVSVRLHMGLLEALLEHSAVLVSLMGTADTVDRPLTEHQIDTVGVRIAHTLGWFTSRAQHPRPTPEHTLSPQQTTFAIAMAVAAQAFVLAHEMAHVVARETTPTGSPQTSYAREFLADAWAVRLLLSLRPTGPPPPPPALELSPVLTIPAAAMFLCYDSLRRRFDATWATTTHPPTDDRLWAIRREVAQAKLEEPVILRGFDQQIDLFNYVLPHVHRNHPDWVLSTEELREWATISGVEPSSIPDGRTATYREVYTAATLHELRTLARAETVSPQDVAHLQDLVTRMPGVVIDLLGRAYDGELLPPEDPDATVVHTLGMKIAGLFADPALREALIPG